MTLSTNDVQHNNTEENGLVRDSQHKRHTTFATLRLLGQFSTLSTNETQHIDIQCNNTQLNRLIRDEQHSVKHP